MGRHRLDATSLVLGIVFALAAAAWFGRAAGWIDARTAVVALPVALIVLGALGMAASVLRPRRDRPN